MSSDKIGFALRPGVFSPAEIAASAAVLDQTDKVSDIFIPDGRSGYEAIEVASSILSRTSRVHAGTGVIRLPQHDLELLARRVQTLQGFSSNRFLLGVGTGTPGPKPGMVVTETLRDIAELRKAFESFSSGVKAPEVYLAALKKGIARRANGKVDGLILNFCSPQHAADMIETAKTPPGSRLELACYLKTFYSSHDDETASRLLVQEFLNYDFAPQYHEMFMQDGTARVIAEFRQNEDWKHGRIQVPRELLTVSLPNPSDDDLRRHIRSFRVAGVTLPVIYPYFPVDEKSEFKLQTVKRILDQV